VNPGANQIAVRGVGGPQPAYTFCGDLSICMRRTEPGGRSATEISARPLEPHMSDNIILEMRNITKEFPGVKALDDISFRVKQGEIHCLVGENGAGKSTLMKVLSGVYPHGSYSGEYSIEVDPRETDDHTIALLRELGFNRLSLGVQDFEPAVQKAVNRIQPREITLQVMEAARREGFKSISVDLIYGLPGQSVASFDRTVNELIAQDPDRVSVFNYAHLPDLFKTQRQIDASALPPPAVKLDILRTVIERLTAAGYVYIGMDHFAKPDDELALAQRAGTLYRNFQGYSTHADCDLIGLGATSIGMVGDSYSQNLKGLEEYYGRIDENRLAVFRGVRLDADDRLRRAVITELICHFALKFAAIERQFGICFRDRFAVELAELTDMQSDGLLALSETGIEVLPPGRLLIRNICMVFDRYLREQASTRFSRVI